MRAEPEKGKKERGSKNLSESQCVYSFAIFMEGESSVVIVGIYIFISTWIKRQAETFKEHHP